MPYYVRPMRKEDVPQVNLIDREAFPTQWPPPNYSHELDNQFAHYLVACDEARRVEGPQGKPSAGFRGLAAKIRGWFVNLGNAPPRPGSEYVIGFAGIWVMADESHLTNIAVRQSYQRQGVGELLVICVIDLSAQMKAETVTLEVRVSNEHAQSLYRKYRFAEAGLRRAYYTDNREDALLMTTDKITSAEFQAEFQKLKAAHSLKWGSPRYQLGVNPAQPGSVSPQG